MKIKLFLLSTSVVVLGVTIIYTCSQPSNGNGFSGTDKELTHLLALHNYTGRIQEQLETRLGRKLDPKKIELGKLIFFDKGLAWHQDNSCVGCHAPAVGFGDSQFMAIGVESNGVVGKNRKGPRNQRRSPMVINTGFYPSLMWNGRFFSNTDDPFDNSKGFTFPAPEADTFFRSNDHNINHLLIAQAHMPFTELPEMAGFRNSPAEFNMSKFQGFLLHNAAARADKKRLSGKPLFTNTRQAASPGKKLDAYACEQYDVSIFSDDDTGFPLPPFENSFVNFPIRRKTLELINKMPEYRRLFAEIYPESETGGIEFFMIGQAIAEFEFFLTFATAPIDKFAIGQYNALTEQEKRGAILFFKKGNCVACHSVSGSSNEMFSDFRMHNVGIPQLTPKFGIETGNVGFATLDALLCRNGTFDLGRFEFDGLDDSKFLFRTSPLRNVALQPSFFHNGAFDDLRNAVVYHLNPRENIRHYKPQKNGISSNVTYHEEGMKYILARLDKLLKKGINLTSREVDDLVAFLSVGLLDPGAKPENLNKLIPKTLPSGADLPTFKSNNPKLRVVSPEKTDDERSSQKLPDNVADLWIRASPNPFADRTTVAYNLPMNSRVRYTLLDVRGRVLRQTQSGAEQSKGQHKVQVDGQDLPAGQYLYRIQAGPQSHTLRLTKSE